MGSRPFNWGLIAAPLIKLSNRVLEIGLGLVIRRFMFRHFHEKLRARRWSKLIVDDRAFLNEKDKLPPIRKILIYISVLSLNDSARLWKIIIFTLYNESFGRNIFCERLTD